MQERIKRRHSVRRHGLSQATSRAHLLSLGIALACTLAFGPACTDDDDEKKAGPGAGQNAAGAEAAKAEAVYRVISGTPLKIKIPADWTLDDVDPGPEPVSPAEAAANPKTADAGPAKAAPSADNTKLGLESRTMLSARAPESTAGSKLKAWLMVLHDPFLPLGTTSTDYLSAQRASNMQALNALQHVEAERSRRQGRPAYYVRDEWTAPLTADKSVAFSQETLLLLDAAGEYLHGYSITVTLPKDDRPALAGTLREMLESVRFQR